MVKKILLAEFLVIFAMISMNSYGYSIFGWEKAFLHQYCMNDGTEKVETLHSYKIDNYNDQLYKSLRFDPNAIGQTLMLAEMAIYLWLIFKLWKQDRDNFKLKIITEAHCGQLLKNVQFYIIRPISNTIKSISMGILLM